MIQHFLTDTGIVVPAISAEQMREVDRIAMEETGPNLFQMMENAGRNLALTAMERMGEDWQEARYVVLAGSGGNGGGGICAARHLANRGLEVLLCLTRPEGLSEVTAFQRHIYHNTGGREISVNELPGVRPSIILDAIIGYSLAGAPQGPALAMIRWASAQSVPKIALDVPSGLDATSGRTPGDYLHADVTLTLALPKTGLLPEKTGKLLLADIGIPPGVYKRLGLDYRPPFGPRFRVPLVSAKEA
ncbi:MAG: NAD(P)H-hydrate epimerase [Calditrichaeota bacterium]|nr:MAG: NAD(P)H-hydrate epimerase [Calditrichota bacterium]